MSRNEIYKEMEETLGVVPSFFKKIPDSSLELEWNLWKKLEMEDGPIPQKYRELLGVAVSAATKCRYCSYFHTELARVNGASEAEIEGAVQYAKMSTGWSTFINGMQFDEEEFKKEVKQACDFALAKSGGEKELRCSDVGEDCDYVVRGKSEEEIFRKVSKHAREAHGMEEIPEEVVEKARMAIHAVAK